MGCDLSVMPAQRKYEDKCSVRTQTGFAKDNTVNHPYACRFVTLSCDLSVLPASAVRQQRLLDKYACGQHQSLWPRR